MQKHHAASHSLHNKTLPALLSLLVLAGMLIVTACGGSSGPTTPDAHTLITRAQAAIQKVTSYHFNLTVDNPGTGSTLVIKTADGDILVPDKLKASATVLVIGNVVQVKIITIGPNQYITDPISNNWLKTSGLLDPRTLSDPNKGVSAILGNIQNPSTPADSSVDGNPCWSINGTLDARYLAAITGGGAPANSAVKITTCIGKTDNLPYLIKITGIAAPGDSANTARTFKLSKFGETLTITPPI